MKVTRWAVMLAAPLLFACGAAAVPTAPDPSPPAGAVQVGDADDGRTISVQLGRQISVTLHRQNGFQPWSGVDASNGEVLTRVVDVRNAAPRGVTLGLFAATARGEARLTANAGVDCSPGMACPALVRVWTVTVEVA